MAARKSSHKVKRAFHNFTVAVTGRYAVSLPIFLLVIPFGFAIGLEREFQLNPTFPATHAALNVTFGFFTSFLYIFIAQATLLKNRKKTPQPLWRCIFVWFTTGLVQGLSTAIYAHLAFNLAWDLPMRLSMTTFYIGSALALVSFYFGTIERRRVEDIALQRLESLLSVDQGEMAFAEESSRSQALHMLQQVLKPQIEKLQKLTVALRSSDGREAKELAALSQEIAAAIENEADEIQGREKGGSLKSQLQRGRESLLSGLFPHELSVRISVLLMAFGSFTGQFPRNGLDGVLAGFIGTALIAIVLIFLSKIVKRHLGPERRTYIFLAYLCVFLSQSTWTYLQPSFGFHLQSPYNPFYSGAKTLWGVYIASIVSTLIVQTSGNLDKSKSENERLREEISFLVKEQEILDKHLQTTRFGTLQGKISGVIMALQLIDASSENVAYQIRRDELIENAISLLNDALSEIEKLGQNSAL